MGFFKGPGCTQLARELSFKAPTWLHPFQDTKNDLKTYPPKKKTASNEAKGNDFSKSLVEGLESLHGDPVRIHEMHLKKKKRRNNHKTLEGYCIGNFPCVFSLCKKKIDLQ